jgi:hypothetical protein
MVSRTAYNAAMLRLLGLSLSLLVLGACNASRPSGDATVTASPAVTPMSAPPTASPSAVPTLAGPIATAVGCEYSPLARVAVLQDRAVREASALAASHRWPGAFWTLNDSGNDATVYAFDTAGRSVATVQVDRAENVDWEALQVGPGPGGRSALYIGDLGDNEKERKDANIYRIPEPDLSGGANRPASGRTAPAEVFHLTYPNGARDVEAMLVHPKTGEVVLVSKEYNGRAQVYGYPTPLDPDRRVQVDLVAELDLSRLGPVTSAVTDGAVSPDGRRAVLRTYSSALEYDLTSDASLASIWSRQQPRLMPLDDGAQGEGITYRADGKALLTIGEVVPAVSYQAELRCG